MTANDLVKGILNDISIKIYQGSEYGSDSRAVTKKKLLVLLCGSRHEQGQVLKAVLQAGLDEGGVTVMITRAGERFWNPKQFEGKTGIVRIVMESEDLDYQVILRHMGRVWCPNITQASLAKLATGITDTMATCVLWGALGRQMPVKLTVNSALTRVQQLPEGHPMKAMLDGYLRTVESFDAELSTGYEAGAMDAQTAETAAEALGSKQKAVRLIHEGNLESLVGPGGKLVLTKGQIITPAARDRAKSRNIELTWK